MALMSTRTSPWPAGVPCWVDLAVPDPDAVQAFYERVLGWTFEGTGEEYGGYRIATVRGQAVAGLGPSPDGAPSAWTLHLATEDADKTAAEVTAAGGTVLLPPGDVGPLGRMSIAADPSGAAFGIWQAGTHIGAGLVNEPGGLTWEDLRSTGAAAAQDFYRTVFGYRFDAVPMAGEEYRTFALPDEEFPLGGMGPMMGSPEGTPSHWLVYFGTAGTDVAVAAATATGGAVVVPAFDSPFGRLAVLADPAGASFAVIETAGSPQPDRAG
jgi:predicted enzyme related to lactoylglutathione lyase